MSTFFFFAGLVVAQLDWKVDYTHNSICALMGSTVTMGCSYTYNSLDSNVQKSFWSKDVTDLSSDPKYTERVQYIRDITHDCSLILGNVTKMDQRNYYATFITSTGERFQGKGVWLSVAGELGQFKHHTDERIFYFIFAVP